MDFNWAKELTPEKLASGSKVPLRMIKTFEVETNLLLPLQATRYDSFSGKERKRREKKRQEEEEKEHIAPSPRTIVLGELQF